MHRRHALKAIVAGFAFKGYTLLGQNAIKVEPLTGTLSLLTGAGGNILIHDSADGLLVVDTGLPETADAVEKSIQTVSKAPITTVINTHWHADHTGGNTRLGKDGAKILAHSNTAKHLARPETIAFMKRESQPLPPEGQPKQILAEHGLLTHAKDKLNYEHLPPAHTDGDTTIHFHDENVLHAGDLLFNGFYPFIDYSTGGRIEGMIAAAERLYKVTDSNTRIVPGHGPVCTKVEVKQFHDMLAGINEKISPLIKSGKSAEEIQAAEPTKQFDPQWGGGFLKPADFVRMLIEGKRTAA